MRTTVLCVDGDGDRRAETVQTLTSATPGETAFAEAATISDVRGRSENTPVDCVVTEYDLPDGTGIDVASLIRENRLDAACVLYTGTLHDEVDTTGAEEVVVEFVPRDRPGSEQELGTLVDHLLRARTHTAYPLPTDEAGRLSTVAAYQPVVDDAADSIDRLTDVAAAHFDASVAYVTFMFKREQTTLGKVGEFPTVLPREDTVCTYTMLEEGVTVIEDLASDPLFRANESLEDTGLRFYAGTKLVSPGGHVLGTFCVMDEEPRSLSESERSVLAALGEEAMEQLELRRRLASRVEVQR